MIVKNNNAGHAGLKSPHGIVENQKNIMRIGDKGQEGN